MAESAAIATNLVLQVVVGLVLLLVFEQCRHLRPIYRRKADTSPSSAPFGWIPATLSVSEAETLRIAGVDGYVLLRYVVHMWQILEE